MHFLTLKILTQYNLLAPQKDTCSNIIKWLGSIDKPPAYLQKVSSIKWKVIKMRTKLYYENRIKKLESRDATANARIIKALKRELRRLQS